MLRVSKCVYSYPSKSVFEDLITRSGPATHNCWSPFEGQADEVRRQFVGELKGRFKQSDFLKYVLDVYKDFDPTKVASKEKTGMLETKGASGKYTTLEELIINGMEDSSVHNHVVNMCVGYKKNANSPLRTGAEYYTVTLTDDDDGEIEEKYLLTKENNELSNEDYEDIIRQLPYIMKSIWSYSKIYKANLFSFIFAYMDIKNKYDKGKPIKVTLFREYQTIYLKSDGSFKRFFIHDNDNKYTVYPAVTKIFIDPDSHKAEFSLCKKFINALVTLGIDYRDEDPKEYTNEFINSIVCTYLPDNDSYINEYKDVDIEVVIALKPENVFNSVKSNMYINALNSSSNKFDYAKSAYFASESIMLAYRMQKSMYSGRRYKGEDLLEEDEGKALEVLKAALRAHSHGEDVPVPIEGITFESDGFLYFRKEIFVLEGKMFGFYKGSKDYYVALSKYGYAIILEEFYETDIAKIPYDYCIEALKEYEEIGQVQQEADWRYIGADFE